VVIAVPCTTTPRDLPSHIELDPEVTGLREVTYARCEDVKSVSYERLRRRLGAAHPEAMFAVSTALRFLLDL
jgi:mRNA interferase MazF